MKMMIAAVAVLFHSLLSQTLFSKIFATVKPGAVILYIENAGGGFTELVTKEAKNCNLESLFYKNHETYIKTDLNVKKFGYVPCFESRVSVIIWRKRNSGKLSCFLPSDSYKEQDFPLSTIAILPSRNRENNINNETVTSNNRVLVPRTPAPIDHSVIKEVLSVKKRTSIHFVSSEVNTKTVGNSLGKSPGPEKKEQPKKILAEGYDRYRISMNTINSNNTNFVGKQKIRTDSISEPKKGEVSESGRREQLKKMPTEGNDRYRISTNTISSNNTDFVGKEMIGTDSISEAKKSEESEYSQGKLVGPQRKKYSKEFSTERFLQTGIARTIRNLLQAVHETSLATISNVKNTNTFQIARDNSPETRITINRREVTSGASISSRNTSKAFNWMNCIRDVFFQELLGLITGEFVNLFRKDQISIITFSLSQPLGERFQRYLFESFE